jgi:hypothetical protein
MIIDPPSKQVEHVVDEAMNEDELVMNDNCISLKERPTKDVEGEFTSNSYWDEEFVPLQDEGLNEPQQDGRKERPKNNVRSGLVIGGLPPKKWNVPP